MTSHSDNQYGKNWLESFQPLLSPHITFRLHPSISHSFLCSLSSLHCLICFPHLKSSSVCPSSSYPSHHASSFSVTHPPRPPFLRSRSLYLFHKWVYIFHMPNFFFLSAVLPEDITCASLRKWINWLLDCPSPSVFLPIPDLLCCPHYTELLMCLFSAVHINIST